MSDYVDIVFDGPPSHEAGRFVEVEDSSGQSIKFGEWIQRDDGYWALRVPDSAALSVRIAALKSRLKRCTASQYCLNNNPPGGL